MIIIWTKASVRPDPDFKEVYSASSGSLHATILSTISLCTVSACPTHYLSLSLARTHARTWIQEHPDQEEICLGNHKQMTVFYFLPAASTRETMHTHTNTHSLYSPFLPESRALIVARKWGKMIKTETASFWECVNVCIRVCLTNCVCGGVSVERMCI